jgi:hypothetical protein
MEEVDSIQKCMKKFKYGDRKNYENIKRNVESPKQLNLNEICL